MVIKQKWNDQPTSSLELLRRPIIPFTQRLHVFRSCSRTAACEKYINGWRN
jgi:hypothetical protein